VGAAITGTENTPSGPPLTVDLLDANGNITNSSAPVTISVATNPGGATLSGTTTVNASGGVASFSTLKLNKAGYGYVLGASSSGVTGANSAAFNEFDVSSGTPCTENVNCSGTATDSTSQGNQSSESLSSTATFDPNNPDAGTLEVALNRNAAYWTAHAAQCGNYSFLRADTDVVNMTASSRGKSFTDTLTVPAVNFGALSLLIGSQQYCLVAPYSFTGSSGPAAATTQPDGTPGFIGLLATCSAQPNQPCISSRSGALVGLFGTLTIVVNIPAGEPGDPQGRG
jgi:hypothetical protein